VQKDPSKRPGYAWLAIRMVSRQVRQTVKIDAKSEETSQKALQLDDNVGLPWPSLGRWAYDWDWSWCGKRVSARDSIIVLATPVHGIYARYLEFHGRFEEHSRDQMLRTRPLDLVLIMDLGINPVSRQ